jgi:hypothetical protein
MPTAVCSTVRKGCQHEPAPIPRGRPAGTREATEAPVAPAGQPPADPAEAHAAGPRGGAQGITRHPNPPDIGRPGSLGRSFRWWRGRTARERRGTHSAFNIGRRWTIFGGWGRHRIGLVRFRTIAGTWSATAFRFRGGRSGRWTMVTITAIRPSKKTAAPSRRAASSNRAAQMTTVTTSSVHSVSHTADTIGGGVGALVDWAPLGTVRIISAACAFSRKICASVINFVRARPRRPPWTQIGSQSCLLAGRRGPLLPTGLRVSCVALQQRIPISFLEHDLPEFHRSQHRSRGGFA